MLSSTGISAAYLGRWVGRTVLCAIPIQILPERCRGGGGGIGHAAGAAAIQGRCDMTRLCVILWSCGNTNDVHVSLALSVGHLAQSQSSVRIFSAYMYMYLFRTPNCLWKTFINKSNGPFSTERWGDGWGETELLYYYVVAVDYSYRAAILRTSTRVVALTSPAWQSDQ